MKFYLITLLVYNLLYRYIYYVHFHQIWFTCISVLYPKNTYTFLSSSNIALLSLRLHRLRMIRAKRFRKEANSKPQTATVTESPVTGDDGLTMSKHCSDDEDNESANESDAASTPGNMSEPEVRKSLDTTKLRGFAKKKKFQKVISLGIFVFGKLSQNSPKLVLIFWSSIPCVFCLYIHC